jgi:cysteine-rich repeat protein
MSENRVHLGPPCGGRSSSSVPGRVRLLSAAVAASMVVAVLLVASRAGAQSTNLSTYSILGNKSLRLGKNAHVKGGNVGVNQVRGPGARVGTDSLFDDGTAVAASRLRVDGGVTLFDAFYDQLSVSTGDLTVRGTVADFAAPSGALFSLAAPTFTPGVTAVDVAPGQQSLLVAGQYGTVTVGAGATLELSGGIYQISSLIVQNGAAVRAAAPVVVNVARKLVAGERVFIGPKAGSGIGYPQIRFNVGAKSVTYGRKASLVGIFYAPASKVRMLAQAAVRGQVVGNDVRVAGVCTKCGNGRLDSGEACDGAADQACPGRCDADCTCMPPPCGNGQLDVGEQCDVGLDAACPGLCDLPTCQCKPALCGNGALDPGEGCDVGNDAACPGHCVLSTCQCGLVGPECGNGVLAPGEQCDVGQDGACPGQCNLQTCQCPPACGNGQLDAGETCDVGHDAACPGSCDAQCQCPPPPTCGNGVLDGGEQCDLNHDAACPGQCDLQSCQCPAPPCGNGVLDAGEQCDVGRDGACPGQCVQATCQCPPPPPRCGDGTLDPGEDCDVGHDTACPGNCNPVTCLCPAPPCGNGQLDPNEQCDVGNDGACPGQCNLSTCQCPPPAPYCGDGTLDAGEQCELGNDAACPGSCDFATCSCRPTRTCGDGTVDHDLGEECDDGNTTPGDGCDATCHIEPGTYCTFTQGGWGGTCHGGNAACILQSGFASAFPTGLIIGDVTQNPPDNVATAPWEALWTSASAISSYLPATTTGGALGADYTDATSTAAGVLGGQLVAAKLDIGVMNPGLAQLHYLNGCVNPLLDGLTVAQVIALADDAVAGNGLPAGVSLSDLTTALDVLNQNFDNCTVNQGCLGQ